MAHRAGSRWFAAALSAVLLLALTAPSALAFRTSRPGSSHPNTNIAYATVVTSLPYTDSKSADWLLANAGGPAFPAALNCIGEGDDAYGVWYKYTPAADGGFVIDTVGSGYDTVLTVWEQNGGMPALLGCSDDAFNTDDVFGNSLTSRAAIDGKAGVSYYIRVTSYDYPELDDCECDAAPGMVINITASGNVNDFTDATVVGALPFTDAVPAATVLATGDDPALFPEDECGYGSDAYGIWYAFTPTTDGPFIIDTTGSSYDTMVSVWTKQGDGLGTYLGCNDDRSSDDVNGSSVTSHLVVNGQAGVTYLIRVGSYDYPELDDCRCVASLGLVVNIGAP